MLIRILKIINNGKYIRLLIMKLYIYLEWLETNIYTNHINTDSMLTFISNHLSYLDMFLLRCAYLPMLLIYPTIILCSIASILVVLQPYEYK